MASVNKVILIGNLGRDPEVGHTAGGTAYCNFSIATSERFGKGDDRKEKTEWHRIVAWGRLGEICGEHLSKGRSVYIEGRLETRQWEAKDGSKRESTQINARTVEFLADRKSSQGSEWATQGDRSDHTSAQQRGASNREQQQRESKGSGGGFDFGPPPLADSEIPF